MISERLLAIEPSPTLALTGKVAALRSQGVEVINFGAGEPDFNTPEKICEAAHKAIRDGKTKYTASAGIIELREAICEKSIKQNRFRCEPKQVVVSCGAKQSVYGALMTLINPGDEVILISPYWMTYKDQVLLAGGTPVVVETETDDGFVPSGDRIKSAVTFKTKAIVINSPGNPTGAVYPRQVLKEIGALAIRHNLFIISDEIYEKLVYDGAEHVSIASLGEDVASRTITINGVSKTFAMTGWRIGWSVSPPEIAANISKLQDQVTSNAATVSQYAALAALQLSDDEIQDMVCEFDRRRMTMLAELAKIPGVRLQSPRGAFYAFANFESAMADRIQDDCTLAELLLDSARVACVPGSVFGGKGHLRLSYTLSPERISLGVAKIAQALESLR